MIHDDAVRQRVYLELLAVVHARIATISHVPETEVSMSLGRALNLLFLLRGHLAEIGEYVPTILAVSDMIGYELLWVDPKKAAAAISTPAPIVQ